ncbi:MAG: 2-amino-4-hydroxy-6-hydroxymethyldihydropteridine diphosphokinase [Planctomycetes bacterium]|nr:2-amino-4-hydroxy-6-hydroxymethyldihydropteridine diphosphokinase [Planctomycetota bacterium]
MQATVALGSNLGERAQLLDSALAELAALPWTRVIARSGWHETEPVGGPLGQPRFLNGVVRLATALSPRALLVELQRIERAAGRDRAHELHHGPRRLDLDLVFHGEARLRESGLELPHPRAEERLFVLEPLAEIAPQEILPGCGLSVAERVRELRAASAKARARTGA